MGFVEAISGKFFENVKNIIGFLGFDSVDLLGTLYEDLSLFCHFFGFFLTHCPAQNIGSSQGVAGNTPGRFHHLFLINHYPIGFCTHIFQQGVRKLYGTWILFSFDVIWNPVHGTRTVEGNQGNDFVNIGNGHLPAKPSHSLRLKLKYSDCLGIIKK